VVDADPGRRFAFDVAERWTDRRPAWFARLAGAAMGIDDIRAHNRRNMEATLDNLARAVARSRDA